MGNQQLISYNGIEFTQHKIYKNLYISRCGKVWSRYTKKLKYYLVSKAGYAIVSIWHNGKRVTLKLHRLVAETFLPPPEKELIELCKKSHWGVVCVKHLDNNKLNNCVDNLMWDSQEENNRDATRDGIVPALKGSLNGRSVLKEDLVHEICKFYEKGYMPSDAVNEFGISKQQASKIRVGIAWKHISVLYNIPAPIFSRKKFND